MPTETEVAQRLLDRIEASWRSALSRIAHGDPVAAVRDVEEAGAAVHELEDAARDLGMDELAEVRARLDTLEPLRDQLMLRSRVGQERIRQSLDQARTGSRTLSAYRGRPFERSFDQTL